MRRLRPESTKEKIAKYRGVLLIVSVPIALILAVLLLMPRAAIDPAITSSDPFDREAFGSSGQSSSFAVIFDAGSSGSRVHVYKFNRELQLMPMDDQLELFKQLKPGLSSHAADPVAAANSLKSLLDSALKVVPESVRAKTPVRLGATAGLRALAGSQSNDILHEVVKLLSESSFKFISSWVRILDGVDEGAFQWVTVNYLLGNLGKDYSDTVGIVDLGGGSVQMAYAIAEEDAAKAPKAEADEDAYVKKLKLLGKTYNLYVHSYLHFGLLAARAEVLKLVKENGEGCPCIPSGFASKYTYSGEVFPVVAPSSGADLDRCEELVAEALDLNQTCKYLKCTFKGIWSGGGGAGQVRLFVASFFFDRAAEVGIISDTSVAQVDVKPSDYRRVAQSLCSTSHKNIHNKFPGVPDDESRGFICLDLVYQYTLLVKGFGIHPDQKITLVKRVSFKGFEVEAAWPLGSAIEAVSQPSQHR